MITDKIAGFGERLKELAQLREQTHLREGVLVLVREDDPKRKLILVAAKSVERVVRVLHEGFGAAH